MQILNEWKVPFFYPKVQWRGEIPSQRQSNLYIFAAKYESLIEKLGILQIFRVEHRAKKSQNKPMQGVKLLFKECAMCICAREQLCAAYITPQYLFTHTLICFKLPSDNAIQSRTYILCTLRHRFALHTQLFSFPHSLAFAPEHFNLSLQLASSHLCVHWLVRRAIFQCYFCIALYFYLDPFSK